MLVFVLLLLSSLVLLSLLLLVVVVVVSDAATAGALSAAGELAVLRRPTATACRNRVSTEVTFSHHALSTFALAYLLELLIDDLGIWDKHRLRAACNINISVCS